MRKNQKGFTLVELIIAIAILAIVTLAICGFIVVGSRSYTSANTDIMLQQDAQLAFNQISDVIIDTTDSISYGVRSGGAGDMQLVLKDSEYAGEATEKCLIVVNRQEAGSLNDNKSYWFYWNKEKEIIYFNEVEASSDMSEADIRTAFESAADMSNVSILAQHVQEFSVDISQFEENRVVMLSAVFANGNREYVTSNNVTVRNRIALNQITVDPMTRATEFTINVVNNIILEPGDFFSLSTIVDVQTPSSDKELKWELVGGAQNGTSIVESSGDLRLGIGETRTNFTVKVSRANEEYAGQNDRVSKTIIVNVKRATAVNISGPSTAKQGETVNLTGAATGNLLGVRCVACPTDVLTEDDDLITSGEYIWKIIEGNQYGQITNPTAGSAVLQINADATPGAKIRVQAASKLSYDKNGGYGNPSTPTVRPVTGTYEVVIEKKASDSLPMPSDFKFGIDNDEEIGMTLPWLTDGITAGTTDKYLIYARVKDPVGGTPDRVILYYTNVGDNIRFYPDMFGLQLNRNYEVYLQAILPVPMSVIEEKIKDAPGNRRFNHNYEYDQEVINEIIYTPGTLDESGRYIGTKFDKGNYYEGTLSPPVISIKYNGVTYPLADETYYEKYSLVSKIDPAVGLIQFYDNGVMNINASQSLNKAVKFGIYKGEGDNIDDWTFVAGYDPDGLDPYDGTLGSYKNTNFGNDVFRMEVQDSGHPDLTSSNFIRRDTNKMDAAAVGTYHIVPGFIYANQEQLSGRNYKFIYRDIGTPDFNQHYFLQTDCTITLKVDMGLNLELNYGGKSQGLIYFPLPTDAAFPFGKEGNSPSKIEWKTYEIFTEKGASTGTKLENVTVTCSYSSSTGIYTIKFTKNQGGKGDVIYDYGTYKWKAGDKQWTLDKSGVGAKEGPNSTWGTRIYFEFEGQQWMMEMPLPGNGWPIDWENDGNTINMRQYPIDDLLASKERQVNYQIKFPNGTGDRTVFELYYNGKSIGQWKVSNDKTQWNKVN